MTDEFATPDELEEFLGFAFDAADVSRASALLWLASGEIRGHCNGEHIAPPQEETLTQQMSGERLLFLPHAPAIPVTVESVTVDGVALDSDAWRHAQQHGRRINALERTAGRWRGEVAVIYTHGFDDPPSDVVTRCLTVAARMWTNPEAHMQRRRGDASTAFASSADEASGLTEGDKRALARYRR